MIARFDREPRATVDERVRALPNLAARSYRHEVNAHRAARANGHATRKGASHVVLGGRRGYAVDRGPRPARRTARSSSSAGSRASGTSRSGDPMLVDRGGRLRVVGIAVSPDNVAFPLARDAARLPSTRATGPCRLPANLALLWLADPDRADITLAQARAKSFGIGGAARSSRAPGIQVLLGQAAGIVIALLVAFSLVALVAAGTMLAAGAHADVQRRLPALGVQRALGFTPRRLAAAQAGEAALLARAGRRARARRRARSRWPARRPTCSRSSTSSRPARRCCPCWPPCLVGITALVARRRPGPPGARPAARRPRSCAAATSRAPRRRWLKRPAARRRGAARRRRRAPLARCRAARGSPSPRAAVAASVATIAVCAGVVTLMLALAALLERLRDDPGTVGKRYQLTARLDPFEVDAVRRSPASPTPPPRYSADVADSFRLGEPLRLVAYPATTRPSRRRRWPTGRRLRSDGEVEVGVGLADALGLRPGSTLAVQPAGGDEVALPRQRRRARARERRPRRLGAPRPAARRRARHPLDDRRAARARRRPRARSSASSRRSALRRRPSAARRRATPRSSACSRPCCAASASPSGSSACTRCPGARDDGARAARRGRAAARVRRRTRAPSRRVLAGAALAVAVPAAVRGRRCSSGSCSARSSRRLAAGFAALPLAPARRPRRARARRARPCSPRRPRRSSRAARCASP